MTGIIQAVEKRYYSPEEYLALEEAAEYKSEYYDGEIVPMTGGTTNHNQIAGNVYIALSLALKGQNYRVFIGDVRLWIPKKRSYTYPDVMVTAGKPEYFEQRKDTVTNPQVIVEVLSKSTKAYDRGGKFQFYQTIPSFQEYILIDQSQRFIEQFSKQENKRWSYCVYDEEDLALVFSSFAVEVSLDDVYDKVDFEAEEIVDE
ncbi:Uma2 family endonuclease [Aerosakkonemataceae cyanobacterium BLCC-F154]|uniref:Uma2 family endonuclease n=1 Tax=Floridaenema fluviatile BLCC-F154 TaxID=3153640 RepID=A0ABV4Y5Q9_9CYAN